MLPYVILLQVIAWVPIAQLLSFVRLVRSWTVFNSLYFVSYISAVMRLRKHPTFPIPCGFYSCT